MPIEAAALLRESQTKEERSIDGQRTAAQRTCKNNGWAYGEEYSDVASASEYGAARGVIRKDFERLKVDLETGRFGVLIVPSVSRTARDVSVLEDLRKILVRHKMLWCIGDRVMNPAEPGDTTLILIEGVLAQTFSQNMSKDVRRGVREARAAGRAPAGRCPFGYLRPPREVGQRVVQIPHPVNGHLLRWAVVEAVPSGTSLRAVARRWSTEGLPTREWSASEVRKALLNPAILGMTTHHGELLAGDWPSLVTAEEYACCRDTLGSPTRRRANHQQSTSLLSSIATHEGCGQKISVSRSMSKQAMYRCRISHGGVWLPVDDTDAFVTLRLFEEIHFIAERARARLDSRPEVDREELAREEYDRALSEYKNLNDHWHDMGLKLAEYAAAIKPLREDVEATKRRLDSVALKQQPPEILDPKVYPALWSMMTLDERRHQVRQLLAVALTKTGAVVTPRGV